MKRLSACLFFILAGVTTASAAGPGATVTVSNPIDLARKSEIIELSADQLRQLLGVKDVRRIHVFDPTNGDDLFTQAIDENKDGVYDKYIFQTDLGPNETKTFVLSVGERSIPRLQDFKAYGRFVQERFDDFAWENDRIADRMYGPALQTWQLEPLTSSAVDVWTKRTSRLVINDWYMVDDYHNDHGEGADLYASGKSRGCGGNGIWVADKFYPSENFRRSKTLANGPIRVMFELEYDPWTAAGVTVSETKRITLDAGQNLSRFESIYKIKQEIRDVEDAIGIKMNPGAEEVSNQSTGILRTWEILRGEDGKGNFGNIGCGIVVSPEQILKFAQADGNYMVISKLPENNRLTYYAGFAWDRSGQVANAQEWDRYLADFAKRIQAPLEVAVKAQ